MKVVAILFLAFCGANANKIVGGSAASYAQFPSIVFQEKSGSFFCGGIIISANRVMSAAHCEYTGKLFLFSKSLKGLTVTAGTLTRDAGGVTKSVVATVVHSNYKSRSLENDIMLLYLSEPFTFSDTIDAAALAVTAPRPGTGITVAGWGDDEITGVTNDLQFVNVEVIPRITCNAPTSNNGEVVDGMICMGNMEGGEDSCQGDSGGPAYIQGTSTVAGITSWGYGCADANKPGVYTDVAYYNDWIDANM